MKKITTLVAVITVTLLCLSGCNSTGTDSKVDSSAPLPSTTIISEDNPELRFPMVAIGDVITFGLYEQDADDANGLEPIKWLVLDINNGQALIVSCSALDCQPYNEELTSVTWETCSLRKWLNDSFINTAFNGEEQKRIQTHPNNSVSDKIFLLSPDEASAFFSSNNDRQCQGTAFCYAQDPRKNSVKPGTPVFWLLRNQNNTGTIACVDDTGFVKSIGGTVSDDDLAIRPALWISLN